MKRLTYQLKEAAASFRDRLKKDYGLNENMIRSLERGYDMDTRTWKALANRGLVEELPPDRMGSLLVRNLDKELSEEGKEVAATLKLIKRLCG